MKKYIVCDLDGTLCDHMHRLHLAWLGKWDEYNAACKYDKPIKETVLFLQDLEFDQSFDIIFLTGRSIKEFIETCKWLNHHVTGSYHIIMRQNGDYRPAAQFKKEQLLDYLNDSEIALEQIKYAIDDDVECCKMFKELGVNKVIQYGK